MSRTILDIQAEIIKKKDSLSDLSNLNSSSIVSVWRLMVYIQSVAIWTIEQLFEVFKIEQQALIDKQKVHNITWYRNLALSYLDGKVLTWLDDTFKYDIAEGDDVEPLKVVKRCAVVRAPGELLIKIAGEIAPLPNDVATRFELYYRKVIDAGTEIRIINNNPDKLRIVLKVYVDPLVINEQGQLISDITTYPVVDAINAYFDSIEFNGLVVPTYMIDSIQSAIGVKLPILTDMLANYGLTPFVPVADSYSSDAGYTVIDELTINYILNGI